MATLEYADKGLVGVLTPQANTTAEPELNILWPQGVAMLVAQFDDEGATYGLRIPPRTTVVFRPADPADIRPRGLDE